MGGPFATSFRYQWDSAHTVRIHAAAAMLRANANQVRANADAQERASAVDTTQSSPSNESSANHRNELRRGSKEPRDFVRELAGMDGEDGVRIEKILGDDGVYRYVVYINGSGSASSGDLSWLNNLSAVIADDNETVRHIRQKMASMITDPDAEVAIVGFSQGGMIAQKIADYDEFNVKTVMTFGSPEIPQYHNYGGADVVRLWHNGDPVGAIGGFGSAVAQVVTSGDRLLTGIHDLFAGDPPPVPGDSVSFSAGAVDVGSHNIDDYEWVAEQFQNSDDPACRHGREALERFSGQVVEDDK